MSILKCDGLLSIIAFNFNLRRYTLGSSALAEWKAAQEAMVG